MAPHSSTLAWRIPGTGEPGGLPSTGSHRVGHDWSDLAAAAAASWISDCGSRCQKNNSTKWKNKLRQMPWSYCIEIHLDVRSLKPGIAKRKNEDNWPVRQGWLSFALKNVPSVCGQGQHRTYYHVSASETLFSDPTAQHLWAAFLTCQAPSLLESTSFGPF